MFIARSKFAIAARGETIYALGGNSKTGVLNRIVESYPVHSVDLEFWRNDVVGMVTARRGPKAAVVNDKLYVFGGDWRDTVAVIDLRVDDDEWIQISELRYKPSTFDVVPFGTKLYIVGTMLEGRSTTVEVFDTDTHEWTSLKSPKGKPPPSIAAVIEKEYSRL